MMQVGKYISWSAPRIEDSRADCTIVIDCDVVLLQWSCDKFRHLNFPEFVHASFPLCLTVPSLARPSHFSCRNSVCP